MRRLSPRLRFPTEALLAATALLATPTGCSSHLEHQLVASVSTSVSTSASTSTTDAARTTNDLLSTFIQQLQSGQSGRVGYGASGTANSGAVSALLLDFRS